MVGIRTAIRTSTALGGVLLCLISVCAEAVVVASVDRQRVEQNESFSLELTIDSTADMSPDLSVLDADFIIGQTSRLSNTTIVNQQIARSMTWTISLMPKRAGDITIPPITIGNEQSNPVTITVTEPSYEPPGEADVFITSEVDYDETFVQAQVIYTIKIYRAVATRQPALREPTFSGADVLVEVAGDERTYEAILNGRAYNVVERAFALFPQESGVIEVSPSRFEARVLRDGRITGRKVFESGSHSVTVKPIPAPPAEHPNAAWLPAKDVRLADSWSRDADELRAGEPITRNITVSALGQLETQIPVTEPPAAQGVSIYPDKPSLSRRLETGGIRGVRTDQYAMIGLSAGVVTLPALQLPWYDIDAGQWRIAQLPERAVTILPSLDAIVTPGPVEQVANTGAATPALDTFDAQGFEFWRLAAKTLAAAWLLTLFAWWWSSRPSAQPREPQPVPLHRLQARHLKTARKAALANDGQGLRHALLEWGKLEWPDDAPRSIGEFARRVSAPLSDELMLLSRVSYGRAASGWDGAKTAKAIRSFAILESSRSATSDDPLPPLMPEIRA